MKNVFIFANSYIVYNTLLGLEYLFCDKINKVILLKEVLGSQLFFKRYDIETYSTVESCLQHCNTILIINDGNLSNSSLELISKYSNTHQRKCYIFDVCSQLNEGYVVKEKHKEDTPVILCVSLGQYTQQMYIELLLNKIFSDLCVPITQFFSSYTKNFLYSLYYNKILNSSIKWDLEGVNENSLVTIRSVTLNGNSTIQEIASSINQFNADYFIFLIDESVKEECTVLQNLVKYNCYKNINFFIKSHYHSDSNEGSYVLYCDDISLNNDLPVVDVENNDLYKILQKDILTILATPEGITQI